MAEFIKDFAALPALRTVRLLADNGTANGTVSVADIFGQLLLADMLPKLLLSTDSIETVAANVISYAVNAADNNKVKLFLSSGACTINLPATLTTGFFCQWVQWGAGVLTFQSATGAGQTIRSTDGLRSGKQYGSGSLQLMLTNEWLLSGYTQV